MFRFGVQRHVVKASAVQLLYRPGGKEKARERTLSDEEVTALLSCLDDVFTHAKRTPAAIRLMLWTACRRSEILTRSVARNFDRLSKPKIAAFTLHDLRRTVRTGWANSRSHRTSPSFV